MDTVQLRELAQTDIAYFSRWWRDAELIALTSGSTTKLLDSQVAGYFAAMLSNPAQINRIITVNGTVIGHISLTKQSTGDYELQTVIGEKPYLNKGYGTQAIAQMLQLAKQQDAGQVFLYVRSNNARAISAYKKAGFAPAGEIIATNNPNQPQLLKMKICVKQRN